MPTGLQAESDSFFFFFFMFSSCFYFRGSDFAASQREPTIIQDDDQYTRARNVKSFRKTEPRRFSFVFCFFSTFRCFFPPFGNAASIVSSFLHEGLHLGRLVFIATATRMTSTFINSSSSLKKNSILLRRLVSYFASSAFDA